MEHQSKTQNVVKDDDHSAQREQRRRAVRNILFAGGAAVVTQSAHKQWAKPVIHAVTLPAHAGTSGDTTPDPGFSDPVTLTYTCSDPNVGSLLVDINGSISIPLAGVQVDLVLSWTGSNLTGPGSPLPTISVVTQPDGSYSSLDNNIGHGQISTISVVATLPAYPGVDPDSDSIPAFNLPGLPYYCALEPE